MRAQRFKRHVQTGALSFRQHEIMTRLVKGLTQTEVAEELEVRRGSISENLTAVTAKLGAGTSAEALAIYSAHQVRAEIVKDLEKHGHLRAAYWVSSKLVPELMTDEES